jgi:hypothetical protein
MGFLPFRVKERCELETECNREEGGGGNVRVSSRHSQLYIVVYCVQKELEGRREGGLRMLKGRMKEMSEQRVD